MFCVNCGAELPDDAKFCFKCGKPISVSQATNTIPISEKGLNNQNEIRFVPAKCTNCGASLEVDPSPKSAICPYCHCTYMVDQAINNYSISVQGNLHIDNATISVDGAGAENYIRRATDFEQVGEIKTAIEYYQKAIDLDYNNKQAASRIKYLKECDYYSDNSARVNLKKAQIVLRYDNIVTIFNGLILGKTWDTYDISEFDTKRGKSLLSKDEIFYKGKKLNWDTPNISYWVGLIEDAKKGKYPASMVIENEDGSVNSKKEDQVESYIKENFTRSQRVQAIKYYREESGADFDTAKKIVDSILK